MSRLGDVARFIRGVAFKPSDQLPDMAPNAVACMTTKNVQETLDLSTVTFIPNDKVPRDEQMLMSGDIIVSSANSWNLVGKCCWVDSLPYPATAGAFVSILRADRGLMHPRFLYYWCSAPATQHLLRYCGRKTTNISNLEFVRAEDLEIPCPSLDEQEAILAQLQRIDDLRERHLQAAEYAGDLKERRVAEVMRLPVS